MQSKSGNLKLHLKKPLRLFKSSSSCHNRQGRPRRNYDYRYARWNTKKDTITLKPSRPFSATHCSGARFRALRQEVSPPAAGAAKPQVSKSARLRASGQNARESPTWPTLPMRSPERATLRFHRLADQLPNSFAAEHSAEGDKSHSEHTQSSRFRNSQRSTPQIDVPDTLRELLVNSVDVLNGRATHHAAVIQHALNCAAEGKGEVLGSRRASQSPNNRTDEAAAEDCSLRFSVISPANHDKR